MANIINDEEIKPGYGILRHEEGVEFMPGNIELSGLETSLVNVMSRETVLRTYIEQQKDRYDYILIDCMPSLGMITMVDNRTNYAKDISTLLIENYGSRVKIFKESIPMSVRAAEISAEGVSIYQHDPNGKVASAYQSLTEEVLADE